MIEEIISVMKKEVIAEIKESYMHLAWKPRYSGVKKLITFGSDREECDIELYVGGSAVDRIIGFTDTGIITSAFMAIAVLDFDDAPIEDLLLIRERLPEIRKLVKARAKKRK